MDSIGILSELSKRLREINDSNGSGKHGAFVSLANSKIGNWSDLMNKCIMLLPIVEGFERRLGPAGGSENV